MRLEFTKRPQTKVHLWRHNTAAFDGPRCLWRSKLDNRNSQETVLCFKFVEPTRRFTPPSLPSTCSGWPRPPTATVKGSGRKSDEALG